MAASANAGRGTRGRRTASRRRARPTTSSADPVGVLLLEESAEGGDHAISLWIACPNFYVITRYNKSRLYAAAVWALAERLRAAR